MILGKRSEGHQWIIFLDEVVTVLKYNKISTEIYIYIKVFPYGTVSHLTVSTDDVLNNTNNVTYFPKSEKSFKNSLRLKYNKYMSLNNRILELHNILLVLVFIILITSWSW